MSKFLASTKAIITRLVFGAHGFIAIWQVVTFKKNAQYWYLCAPIAMLFFEGLFTLTIKASQEWKWFCPSVFLYLGSVVPAIWLLELDKVERRLQLGLGSSGGGAEGGKINLTAEQSLFDLKNIEDLKHLEEALGVTIRMPDIQIPQETWVTLIEQFLMLILIVGRWMLPKGELTRDQLSQLLLVYIGTAADIIEFFDSFKEERVAREPLLVYLTLGIWSWSLMQFTVVLTATKSRKSRLSSSSSSTSVTASGRRMLAGRRDSSHGAAGCCSIDVWAIAVNMLLQDGPFLAFRMILIVEFKIVSYMNIFFTCKNTLVILLQLYRLYVVQSERLDRRRHATYINNNNNEMGNISIVSRAELYGGGKRPKKRKLEHNGPPDVARKGRGARTGRERRRRRSRTAEEDVEANRNITDSEELYSEDGEELELGRLAGANNAVRKSKSGRRSKEPRRGRRIVSFSEDEQNIPADIKEDRRTTRSKAKQQSRCGENNKPNEKGKSSRKARRKVSSSSSEEEEEEDSSDQVTSGSSSEGSDPARGRVQKGRTEKRPRHKSRKRRNEHD